jgi:hypothetical protein
MAAVALAILAAGCTLTAWAWTRSPRHNTTDTREETP